MASKLTNALAQLKAAGEGQRRTEQYVVEAAPKILQEVSEEEYRQIVEKRREDFVEGEDDLGYADSGKEVWDDPEVQKRHLEESRAEAAARAAAKKAAGKSKDVSETSAPTSAARGAFLSALQAGAAASSGSSEAISAAPKDSRTGKDMDAFLAQMCDAIEADDTPVAAAATAHTQKRKLEATGPGTAGKKAKDAAPVVVKKEPVGPIQSVVVTMPQPDVSSDLADEMKSEAGVAVKVEATAQIKLEATAQIKLEVPHAAVQVKLEDMAVDDWAETTAPTVDPAANGARLQPLLEEDGSVWFFFIDAFEDERSSPPRVYLFGKVVARETGGSNSYQSCCLVVEGVERCFHLLLNVNPDDEDAHPHAAAQAEVEFDSLCQQHCPRVKKLRAKLKHRNYAFEKALPNGTGNLPFLKVMCDSAGSSPPIGFCGQTFSHMFGAQTSMLERLILTRRIQGPSWLRLKAKSWQEDPSRLSYCAVELRITPKCIEAPKTDEDRRKLNETQPTVSPPLRVLSVSLQTVQENAQRPHEAVAIACTMHPNVSPDASESEKELKSGMARWSGVRRLDSRPFPRDADKILAQQQVQAFGTETSLLLGFLSRVQEFDPDVIVGHNAYGFDLDVLASRLYQLKVQPWQKLGRLRRPKDRIPRSEGRQGAGFWVGSNLVVGRLVCDVVLQSRDLLPKLGCHDLLTLSKEVLSETKVQVIEPEALASYFDTANHLVEMAHITVTNALTLAKITQALQILPLSRQLTNLAGNLWNTSLQNKRAERNEILLCHEFHKKKFVLPDKETLTTKKRRLQIEGGNAPASGGLDDPEDQEQVAAAGGKRGKAQYSGGLVLDPKVGLYDEFVMLLDFNSLYPSIIQEHNICFTTVDRPDEQRLEQVQGETELLALTHAPDGTTEEGILPQVLRRLVESRRNVKTAMKSEKDPRRLQMLEIRQKALKLTANSMYGVLGFQGSRFCAKPLAALITFKGREALQSTINVVNQELNLEVVYGDTDSVFVNTKTTDYDQAMQAAQLIKRSVNKRYKRLEIEIDAVFHRLLLLKKKKYAAMKVIDWSIKKTEPEIKGLDIVRRDWCKLAKNIGNDVLMRILKQEGKDGKEEAVHWVHQHLTDKAAEMDAGTVPIEDYVITKALTKEPKDYPDAKNQPHVQVALRLQSRGKSVRSGQEIEYVICEVDGDNSKMLLADKARHPHELTVDPSLKLDIAWYKKQQVHPVVARLLVCVEGTDPARIAECLGMDALRFAQSAAAKAHASELGSDGVFEIPSDISALFDRGRRWQDFSSSLSGVTCGQCQKLTTWRQLLLPGGEQVAEVGPFRCHGCKTQVQPRRAQNLLVLQLRKMLKEHSEGWVQCPEESISVEKTRRLNRGQNMMSERSVQRELEHILYLSGAALTRLEEDDDVARDATQSMHRIASRLLEQNGNNWVDCGQIFGSVFGTVASGA